jgi:TATA-binding protein-associated factor Taf7
MTKQEKVVSLTKYIEKTKQQLSSTQNPQLKSFLERDIKKHERKIESLR